MMITEKDIKFVFSVMIKNISALEVMSQNMPGGPFEKLLGENHQVMDIMFPKIKEGK